MNSMTIQLDFWNAAEAIVVLIGAFWSLMTIIVKQFNAGLAEKFLTLDESRNKAELRDSERFDRLEASQKTQERDFLMLKAELPDKYVRREDAIRSEMTLHAKFDGLASRIDMFLRVKNNE